MVKRRKDPIPEDDIKMVLDEYAKLTHFLGLTPEQRQNEPVPDIDWRRLVTCADQLLGALKDPRKMYPEVDQFVEVEDMDAQKLLFVVEKKALHCADQPLVIQIRSICNYIGFLMFVGRKTLQDEKKFSGVELSLTTHELAFIANSIYQALFKLEPPEEIGKTIESMPQECLRDMLDIILKVANSGHLVAQVGLPDHSIPIEDALPQPTKKKIIRREKKPRAPYGGIRGS